MKIKVYEYKNCSTCQKAIKYLDGKNVAYERLPIVERPPSVKELHIMLEQVKKDGGSFKSLFNTSGVQYREMKIADKINAGMTEAQALKLLSENGKLIKRPFLLAGIRGAVGFKAEIWEKILE